MVQTLYILSFIAVVAAQQSCDPFGIRVALGYYYTHSNNADDIIDISFNTNGSCPDARVIIQSNSSLENSIVLTPNATLLDYREIYLTYIQRAQISDLQCGQEYVYFVQGDDQTRVGPFRINIPKKDVDGSARSVVFFGDMDSQWTKNASKDTFNWFVDQAHNNRSAYDLLVFNGDMAYNLEDDNGMRGEYFLKNLSSFTPYFPLLTTPGNHDGSFNYSFQIISSEFYTPDNHTQDLDEYFNIYSFDLGYGHFIAFNPLWFVYSKAKLQRTEEQMEKAKVIVLESMKRELDRAKSNRADVPWIIVYSHYPMYCSGYQDSQCYENFQKMAVFEDLFREYGVDLYVAAHQHSYERDAPTYRNKTTSFTTSKNDPNQHYIEDAVSPVYIVEGSAGNDYYMETTEYNKSQYTVAQSVNRGVGVLSILNRTHLLYEHVNCQTNQPEDFFYIYKRGNIVQTFNFWIIIGVVIGIALFVGLFLLARWLKKYRLRSQSVEQSLQHFDDETPAQSSFNY